MPCTLAARSRRRSCSSTCSILRVDHAAHRLRQIRAAHPASALRDDPRPGLLDDPAGVAQVAHEVDHEERAAFGLGVDHRRRSRAESDVPGNSSARYRSTSAVLEKRAGRLPRTGRALQVAADRQERMLRQRHVRRTVAGQARARACRRSGRPGSSACRPSRCRPSADRR